PVDRLLAAAGEEEDEAGERGAPSAGGAHGQGPSRKASKRPPRNTVRRCGSTPVAGAVEGARRRGAGSGEQVAGGVGGAEPAGRRVEQDPDGDVGHQAHVATLRGEA